MKIAMFSDSYLPYASGVVRSVATFAKELRHLGDKVYIIAPEYPGWVDEDGDVFRFPSYRFSRRSDFRLAWPFDRRRIDQLCRLDVDLIHSHSPFLLGRLGAALARRLDVPLVFTYHTMYEEYAHYFKWLPRPVVRRLVGEYVRGYCRQTAAVIAPSVTVRDILARTGLDRPLEVLATGVDLSEFTGAAASDARARFAISQSAPLLLFVGRLGREKNLATLLEATAIVVRGEPRLRLLLAGDGPDRPRLSRLARKLGLGSQVVFAGLLDRNALVSAYKAADLFVFSSLTETQGLVIAEALAAGLPLAAVRANGVQDMVRDGVDGLLTGRSASELAAAITTLLEEPELRSALAKNAIDRSPSLSTAKKAAELREIYAGILSNGRAQSAPRRASAGVR